MPQYSYQSPAGEIKDVIQTMSEPHVYEENGIKWTRIFTVPQGNADARIDPFDNKGFVERSGKKRGTVGNLIDASKEASEKRKKIIGTDPIRKEYYDNWSKARNNKKHPNSFQE